MRRDLPWRRTRDPYAIWVSEIMLQQTQVATVIPFFERWVRRFPTVDALAAADEQEVLRLWQGLGYYRRCRMLLQGARWVAEHGFPADAPGWQRVPGVGRYTAGAIASIAMGQPSPLVDGNVERVFARLTANEEAGSALTAAAWDWASSHVDPSSPGDWNQALMELGATVCTPRSPSCLLCPVASECAALATGRAEELPRPKARPEVVALRQTVWVPACDGRWGVRQIPEGQWWQGMWEFPRAGAGEEAQLSDLVGEHRLELLSKVRHTVTHHRIEIEAWLARCTSQTPILRWVTAPELEALPMPAPQRKLANAALKALV